MLLSKFKSYSQDMKRRYKFSNVKQFLFTSFPVTIFLIKCLLFSFIKDFANSAEIIKTSFFPVETPLKILSSTTSFKVLEFSQILSIRDELSLSEKIH